MSALRHLALGALLLAAAARAGTAQMHVTLASHPDSTPSALLAHADRAFAAQRWREAAGLYQSVLLTDEEAPQRWCALGHALLNADRPREAVAAFERALQLGAVGPAQGAWQVARAYAQLGNATQALRWLTHASELGLDARDAMRRDPRFERYRDDPRFEALSDSAAAVRRPARRPRVVRAQHALVYTTLGRQGSNLQLPG